MAIKVASTLIPGSKTYPISIANDIQGGLHTVQTKAELNDIKPARLLNGMLAYVVSEKKYYQLDGTEWKPFSSGGGILQVDTLDNLDSIDTTDLKDGALCYVSSLKTYMVYNAPEHKWNVQKKSFSDQIIVGDTAPQDTSALWLDTTGDRLSNEFYTPQLINSMVSDIRALQKQVNYFKYAFENQINSGDFFNNTAATLGSVETPPESIIDGSHVIYEETHGFSVKKKELKFFYDVNVKYTAFLTSFDKTYMTDETISDVIIELKVGNETFALSKVNNTLKPESELFVTSVSALDNYNPDDIIFSLKGYAIKGNQNIPIDFSCIFGYGDAITYEIKNWKYNNGTAPLEPTEKYIPNVTHVCIKAGKKEDMQANKAYFLDNELLWCTDTKQLYIKTQGTLKLITGSGGPAPIDPENPNTEDPNTTIMNTEFLDVSTYINVKGKPTDTNPNGNGDVRIEDGNISATSATIKQLLKANSIEVNYLNMGGGQYQAKVDEDGSIQVYPWSDIKQKVSDDLITGLPYEHQQDGMKATGAGTGSAIKKVYINSVFAGGNADIHDYRRCSHNYVELSNVNDEDISLNGVSLAYTEDGIKWDVLELRGVIKAGSSYLIRGAQCSVINSNYTLIKVKNCDIEWKVGKELKKFSDEKCAFYLFVGDKSTFEAYSPSFKANPAAGILDWNNSTIVPRGYVEVAGFYRTGTDAIAVNEGGACGTFGKNRLMFKYYQFDPTTAADKMGSFKNRKNSTMWTYIDLDKKDLPLLNVVDYGPKASNEKKNIYTMKSKFRDDIPNYVTCTFGRQATVPKQSYKEIVNGNEVTLTGATRCFNWISTSYQDEYLWITRVDQMGKNKIFLDRNGIGYNEDQVWVDAGKNNIYRYDVGCGMWNGNPGIIQSMDGETSKVRAAAYNRIHMEGVDGTNFTVHKVIIKNLTPGVYKYRVGTSLENYISEEYQFEVKDDATLETTGWNFVQITDQQGFNWNEYEMHRLSCEKIAQQETKDGNGVCGDKGFDFTFNTGDMTQDGNRLSEWIDYYNGRSSLKDYVEMCVIGNNDLGPGNLFNETKGTDAEKINYNQYRWFYTFEIDETNPPLFTITDGKKTVDAFIDSMYSFNYGNTHFICMNSEVVDTKRAAIESCNVIIYGMETGTQKLLMPHIRRWAYADMAKVNGGNNGKTNNNPIRWRIATVHDCPFTIMTFKKIQSYFTRDGQQKYQDANGNIGIKGYRSGSQLNYPYNNTFWNNPLYDDNANLNTFWFSRFCQETGIRLCIGGHKHTHAVSKPVYENIAKDGSGIYSYRPIIPYTSGKSADLGWSNYFTKWTNHPEDTDYKVPANDPENTNLDAWDDNTQDGKVNRALGAWKQFSKITAPGYVTCQATGYKHKSNKELPGRFIPWEFEYTPYTENKPTGQKEDTRENPAQCRPYYMTYKITQDTLTYQSNALSNIWQTDSEGKGFTFNSYPTLQDIGKYSPTTLYPATLTTPSNKYVPIVMEYASLSEIYTNLKAAVPYYASSNTHINLDTYADNMKTEYAYAAFNISTNSDTVSSGSNSTVTITVTYIGESLKGAEVYTSKDMTPMPIDDSTNQITLSNDKVGRNDDGYVTVYVRSTKVPDYVKTLSIRSTL